MGTGWLKSPSEAVRLVAGEALTGSNSRWALGDLIQALDDPFLLNRQFAMKGLEEMLEIRCADYGYRFYMTPAERSGPIRRLQAELFSPAAPPSQ